MTAPSLASLLKHTPHHTGTDQSVHGKRGMVLYRGEGNLDHPSYYPSTGPDADMAGGWWTDNPKRAAAYAKGVPDGKVYTITVDKSEVERRGLHYFIPDPAVRERRQAYVPSRKSYHLTDNPRFELDPTFVPDQNYLAIYTREDAGIYLTDNPEYWVNAHNYVRPFLVEFEVAGDQKHAGVPGSNQEFIPADQYDRLKVTRIVPLDEWVREEFGEKGWVEEHFNPTEYSLHTPYKRPFPDYKYVGPDVRDMSESETQQLIDQTKRYLKEARGIDLDEEIEKRRISRTPDLRKHGNGSHNEKDHNPHKGKTLLGMRQGEATDTPGIYEADDGSVIDTRPDYARSLDQIQNPRRGGKHHWQDPDNSRTEWFERFERAVIPACEAVIKDHPWLIAQFRSAEGLASSVTNTHQRMFARAPFSVADIDELEAYALVTKYRPAVLDDLLNRMEVMGDLMESHGADWLGVMAESFVTKHADHNQKDHGNRYPRNVSIFEDTFGTFHLVGHDTSSAKRGRESTLCGLDTTGFRKAAPFPSGDPRGAVHYERGCDACIDIMTDVTELDKHMGPGDHPSGTPQTTHGTGRYGTSGNKMVERTDEGGDLREGFSITPIEGIDAGDGFMVAIPGHELRIYRGPGLAEAIAAHRRNAWSAFENTPNSYWGGWVDKKTNELVLDVSVRFEDHALAVQAGREWGQDAIFDLYHYKEIRTDDDGSSYEEWKKAWLNPDGTMIPRQEDDE